MRFIRQLYFLISISEFVFINSCFGDSSIEDNLFGQMARYRQCCTNEDCGNDLDYGCNVDLGCPVDPINPENPIWTPWRPWENLYERGSSIGRRKRGIPTMNPILSGRKPSKPVPQCWTRKPRPSTKPKGPRFVQDDFNVEQRSWQPPCHRPKPWYKGLCIKVPYSFCNNNLQCPKDMRCHHWKFGVKRCVPHQLYHWATWSTG